MRRVQPAPPQLRPEREPATMIETTDRTPSGPDPAAMLAELVTRLEAKLDAKQFDKLVPLDTILWWKRHK